ncbi:MAG TPA: hypothetical protein VG297_11850 [Bryobacteraceae bacterium]|jgi:hypothetical protein|nr:hypothetical protein [Bryobacteraceae bacterium]
MSCPLCRSQYLVIRQRVGWEWLVLHFTDKRKYHCIGCGHSFRAPDRRKTPRPDSQPKPREPVMRDQQAQSAAERQ